MSRESNAYAFVFIVCIALIALIPANAADPEEDDDDLLPRNLKFNTADTIEGVYPKCRQYWNWYALGVKQRFRKSPCPFGAFGSVVIKHGDNSSDNYHIDGRNCGKVIETDAGDRGIARAPTRHAEVDAIERICDCVRHSEYCVVNALGQLVSAIATDRTWWQQLTLYTNGESCPLDANAENLAGFGEIVWGTLANDYANWGWPITSGRALKQYRNWLGPLPIRNAIHSVDRRKHDVYLAWQFTNATMPCPDSCSYVGAVCLAWSNVSTIIDADWYPAYKITV